MNYVQGSKVKQVVNTILFTRWLIQVNSVIYLASLYYTLSSHHGQQTVRMKALECLDALATLPTTPLLPYRNDVSYCDKSFSLSFMHAFLDMHFLNIFIENSYFAFIKYAANQNLWYKIKYRKISVFVKVMSKTPITNCKSAIIRAVFPIMNNGKWGWGFRHCCHYCAVPGARFYWPFYSV